MPNKRTSIIYAWLCPDTGKPVYVGKTSQTLTLRMNAHRHEAAKGKTAKARWIAGHVPRIVLLDRCSVSSSAAVERRWQRRLSVRYELLNQKISGCGNPGIGRVKWTDELIAKLGKMSDSDIASQIGCERKTVSYQRECRGIAASFDRTNNIPPPPMGGWNRLTLSQDIIDRLGTEPDYIIGNSAGVCKSVIARMRKRLGIASYAFATGNNGRIRIGEPHRRWTSAPGNAPMAIKKVLANDAF
jgi:hypothetical protein